LSDHINKNNSPKLVPDGRKTNKINNDESMKTHKRNLNNLLYGLELDSIISNSRSKRSLDNSKIDSIQEARLSNDLEQNPEESKKSQTLCTVSGGNDSDDCEIVDDIMPSKVSNAVSVSRITQKEIENDKTLHAKASEIMPNPNNMQDSTSIEKILKKRLNGDVELEYFVKWSDSSKSNTWLKKKSISCKNIIDEFEKNCQQTRTESLNKNPVDTAQKNKFNDEQNDLHIPKNDTIIKHK
jgi:hypothetical protein